jgi:hypothetical protein
MKITTETQRHRERKKVERPPCLCVSVVIFSEDEGK